MRTKNSKELEEYLIDMIDSCDDEGIEVIGSYEDLMLLTGDNGFVVIKGGTKYQITIVEA